MEHAPLVRDLAARARQAQGADAGIAWKRWGHGPAIVLLHGSGGSWTHWVRNIDALSRTHTVLVPDLPGHGESRDSGDRTYTAMGQRIAADIDHMLDGEPCVLAGFSFGSLVAEAIALGCPRLVAHLVLIRGTFTGTAPPFPAGLRSWKHLPPDLERAAHRHNLGVLMLHDPASIDEEAVDIHALNARRARVRPTDFSFDGLEASLERLTAPLTVVRGEFDALGGDADTQREALRLRSPTARFHAVPAAGHWVAYEAPAFINQTLAELDRTSHALPLS
ncbi:alpha/beta fold hydrolase [Hydrogenophaga laconesensis]|uniref:Pimeloyl-ACP methyl ester carboxylesterase n=1 Tax=Hydrogenophaga laconesensis TaxID=1805971 RepID=A0ABU1VBA1_9BURK|nr:alpha/beta fold hydrolase [Hydrogenophaga laconesensis]MDR7094595.1 pimeloyl-ACP methyl ester carboxylesterase [Hydrogenophaga laconesensis]